MMSVPTQTCFPAISFHHSRLFFSWHRSMHNLKQLLPFINRISFSLSAAISRDFISQNAEQDLCLILFEISHRDVINSLFLLLPKYTDSNTVSDGFDEVWQSTNIKFFVIHLIQVCTAPKWEILCKHIWCDRLREQNKWETLWNLVIPKNCRKRTLIVKDPTSSLNCSNPHLFIHTWCAVTNFETSLLQRPATERCDILQNRRSLGV